MKLLITDTTVGIGRDTIDICGTVELCTFTVDEHARSHYDQSSERRQLNWNYRNGEWSPSVEYPDTSLVRMTVTNQRRVSGLFDYVYCVYVSVKTLKYTYSTDVRY